MTALLSRSTSDGARALPVLDALRALAVSCVFAQHFFDHVRPSLDRGLLRLPFGAAWMGSILSHAHWGVDLFFVLSGFTLSLGWLRALEERRPVPRTTSFYRRRAARILPAFYVALAITLLARPWLLAEPGLFRALAAHAVLIHGYVAAGGLTLIGASWSLSTEASFYIVMPWMARLLRSDRRALVGLTAVVVVVWLTRAIFHAVALEHPELPGLFELSQRRWLITRLDQFALGMMAAVVGSHEPFAVRARALAPWLVASALPLLAISFRWDDLAWKQPGGGWPYALGSVATAGLVLGAVSCRPEAWACRWLASAPIRLVGTASYGVFLFHQLVIDRTLQVMPTGAPAVLCALVAFGVSVALGSLSWVAVERPALTFFSSPRAIREAPTTRGPRRSRAVQ